MRNHFAKQKFILNHREVALDQKIREPQQFKLHSHNVRINMSKGDQEDSRNQQVEDGRQNIKLALLQSKFSNENQLVKDIIQLNQRESIIESRATPTNHFAHNHPTANQYEGSERETNQFAWHNETKKQSPTKKNSMRGDDPNRLNNISPHSNITCMKRSSNNFNFIINRKLRSSDRNSRIQHEQNQAKIEHSQFNANEKELFNRLTNDKFMVLERLNTFDEVRKVARGEAELKFREKMKIKLSRRHMYHTLKHKSEIWNKINSNTRSFSPKKQQTNPEQSFNTDQMSRLHERDCRSNTKPFFQSKNHNVTVLHNLRHLRIDSKPMMLQVCNDNKVMLKIKALSNLSENKKTNIEIYEQIMAKLPIQISKCNKTEGNQFRRATAEQIQGNIFRELTPWHGED